MSKSNTTCIVLQYNNIIDSSNGGIGNLSMGKAFEIASSAGGSEDECLCMSRPRRKPFEVAPSLIPIFSGITGPKPRFAVSYTSRRETRKRRTRLRLHLV